MDARFVLLMLLALSGCAATNHHKSWADPQAHNVKGSYERLD